MSGLYDTPAFQVHPAVQFGRLCIGGTRVPVTTVGWSVWVENGANKTGSHDGAQGSAEDYLVTRNDALMACWYLVTEGYLDTVKGERKRKAKWTAWAEHAHRVFGGWDKDAATLCDPDDFVPFGEEERA